MKKYQTTIEKNRAKNNWNSYALALLALPVLTFGSTSLVHASNIASNEESVEHEYFEIDFEQDLENYFEEDDFEFEVLGDEFGDIISDTDWDTLSQADIDAKLKAAGKEMMGDPKDPLYNMTPAQMDVLTDAQWEKIDAEFEALYGNEEDDYFEEDDFEFEVLGDEFGDIISDTDWDTLSQADIDAKLKAAGKEMMGDPKDPLYNMTPAQMDVLTDAQWEKIDAEFEALYGNE